MTNRKLQLAAIPVILIASTLLIGVFAKPVWAQVRAALVRDVDNPALAPFSGTVRFSFSGLNTQALLTTVPAGKRLVVEHVSLDRKSTRLNSSHQIISYAVFCLKKKNTSIS